MSTQGYVNKLVPWSIEVRENYSRLLKVAEEGKGKDTTT
jgi:hypothetical protein